MRSLVLLAFAASACSFQNTHHVKCTEDTECVAAFGTGAVCRSDGYCTGGSAGGDDAGSDSGDTSGSWTFVSFPDFLNADIGDVSALTTAVNSTNPAHEAAIAAVLDAMAAEQPDFVLVAGDLVNGHWYSDASGVQVFGPVGTLAEKTAAVTTAANVYYPQWKKRFSDRGLKVYAALGDHDVGDNNWPAGTDRSQLVPTYKQQWAKQFTLDGNGNPLFAIRPMGTPFENTAYAVRHKNVLIVTVDVFRQDDPMVTIDSKTGSVRNDVVGDQLAWLDSVLMSAATDPQIDHVIVQGHVPVLLPVRLLNSSGLTMPGAGDSEFWQTLSRNKVDLYFAGEVHDMSTQNYAGVEQVVHGGIMGYAPHVSYLVGHVYPDRVELELKMAELV
jgi:3',5'-cyclic AMP phosphodiesterase CpdA